jgi:hypothetical protein
VENPDIHSRNGGETRSRRHAQGSRNGFPSLVTPIKSSSGDTVKNAHSADCDCAGTGWICVEDPLIDGYVDARCPRSQPSTQ